MNFKRITSLLLCIALLLCATACKKMGSDLSSIYSDTSTITEVYHEITVDESSDNTTTSEITQSTSSSTASSDNNTSSKDDAPVNMEEKYGFNSLKSVEFSCVKDIPTGDAEYDVEGVITDKGTNISYMAEIVCNASGVTIDGFNITVPYEYRKNNKSITLTARHRPSGVSVDFKITFHKWNLIFEDEFNGTELNSEVWEHQPNYFRNKGYANYWSDDMTFLDGKGNLVSRAYSSGDKHTDGRPIYYSGAIWSEGLFESTYGYYEISAIPHLKTGMWGAFWILAGDMNDSDAINDNSSINGCEIDVFESLLNLNTVNHAVHWDGFNGNTKSQNFEEKQMPNLFDGKYHTFAVRWSPTEYVFLVDGEVTGRTEAMGICNQPGFMLISTECGTWAGDWVLKEGEYSDMLVDYVRVYTTDSDF